MLHSSNLGAQPTTQPWANAKLTKIHDVLVVAQVELVEAQ